jgi:hypothetical protein
MAVLTSEIRLYKSTTSGYGGAITAIEVVSGVLNNLFDDVTATEARDGWTEYRCFYIRNTSSTSNLVSPSIEIFSDTPSADTQMSIGIGTSAINGVEQIVFDDTTAPTGVSFTNIVNTQVLLGGTLTPNSFKAIWIRRVTTAGALALANDTAVLRVTGETTA